MRCLWQAADGGAADLRREMMLLPMIVIGLFCGWTLLAIVGGERHRRLEQLTSSPNNAPPGGSKTAD